MKKANWKELLIKVIIIVVSYVAGTIGIEIPF